MHVTRDVIIVLGQRYQSMIGQGETPFYVFDESEVRRRIRSLREALPEDTVLCYAMKANPFILEAACREAEFLEVCSPGEYRICQKNSIPHGRLTISGINKDPAHMRELISSPSKIHRFTVESAEQFALLESLAQEMDVRIPVLLRITSGNQFGMDASAAKQLMSGHRNKPHIDFRGIQFFSGTQKSSPSRITRELEKLDKLIESIGRECGAEVLELEYGPGLPVDYSEQDGARRSARDREYLGALRTSLSSLRFNGTVILEMGRAMAASCGTYVTTVIDTKVNRRHSYAIVDGGRHQISYYGHELALTPPVCHAVPTRCAAEPAIWTVCGSLCTSNDILIKQFGGSDLAIGDRLVFPNAGAYCMTEGISLFLSRDLPRIYLTDASGEMRLIRDRIPTDPINAFQ